MEKVQTRCLDIAQVRLPKITFTIIFALRLDLVRQENCCGHHHNLNHDHHLFHHLDHHLCSLQCWPRWDWIQWGRRMRESSQGESRGKTLSPDHHYQYRWDDPNDLDPRISGSKIQWLQPQPPLPHPPTELVYIPTKKHSIYLKNSGILGVRITGFRFLGS